MRTQSLSDAAIAARLGDSLRAYRLRRNLSHQKLAEEIGISRPTLSRLESGSGTIANLIAALRALRRLDLLDALLEPPMESPLQAAVNAGHQRIRAGKRRVKVRK